MNCHSPIQPQLELELDLIMGRKPPTTHTPETFKALPDNLGSCFSVCNLILTQLEQRPQNFIEDDLKEKEKNENENERRPIFFLKN
jgi:hypothetical protein